MSPALEDLVDQAARTSSPGSPRDRYRGVMLGVAVGNALGLPFEGESHAAIRRHRHGAPWEIDPAEGERPWDDDLAQTVLLAEAAVRMEELSLDYLAMQLVHWQEENGRGMGLLTRDVLAEIATGTPAKDAARVVWERSGWSTAGNGAVMRCAPIALRWRYSGRELVANARASALVTHHDARCEWSTVAFDVALAITLSGGALDLDRLAEAILERSEDADDAAMEQIAEAVRATQGATLADLDLDDPMDMGYTLKAMQVGLWCLVQGDGVESALVEVVSAGGDTDTNGAVAGAALGAREGAEALPERWIARIRESDRLVELADQLEEASGRSAA